MLVKIIIGLLALLIVGKAFAGTLQKSPISKLPLLEKADAAQNEIIRISGYPTGSVHYIKPNNTFIIPTKLRFKAWTNLWRISVNGLIIDSFSIDEKYNGKLPASGILFSKENYIDWAFTGDKLPKAYIKILNANQFSKQQLADIFNKASQIVWMEDRTYESVYLATKESREYQYFLKGSEGWSILISTEELTTTEYPQLKSALKEGFADNYQGPDLGISNITSIALDLTSSESPIQLLSFKKEGTSRSRWTDLNSNAWEGDYGYGHFLLRAENDIINFKSFHRILRHSKQHQPDMDFYSLDKILADNKVKFLVLNTGKAPAREEDELGTYIIRPKVSADVLASLKPDNKKFIDNQQKRPLSINFKGLDNLKYGLDQITYYDGSFDQFEKIRTNLTTHPASMPLELFAHIDLPVNAARLEQKNRDKNQSKKPDNFYHSYALKLNEQYFTWSNVSSIRYVLGFDYLELERAFADLSTPNDPVNMEIAFTFFDGGAEANVQISNSKKSVDLKNIRLASVGSQPGKKENLLFVFDANIINAAKAINNTYNAFGAEGPPAEKIAPALTLIHQQVQESKYPDQLAFSVQSAFWFLLNSARTSQNEQLQTQVINSYLDIFPKIGVNASMPALLERAVDFCIATANEDCVGKINQIFFSPETIINYEKHQWLLENNMLDLSFKTAAFNLRYATNYNWLVSTRLFANNLEIKRLAPVIANHYTKLLVKALKDNKQDIASQLSRSFIESVYPKTGYSEKSTDVISLIIVTGVAISDWQLMDQVITDFINNPEYDKGNNDILYYNLACYYAIKGDKNTMLSAIKSSIDLGRPASKFIEGKEFKPFVNDPDFIALVGSADDKSQ
jgi:hypothetical protein